MPLNERDRRALLLGAALIGGAVLFRFGVQPSYAAWAGARAAVAAHDQELTSLEQQLDRRDAIQARLALKYGPAAKAALRSVEDTRVELPKAAQDALSGAGMGIQSIDFQGVRKLREVPGVSMLSFRVQGACSGGSLPAVLAALRTAPMLILLEDAQLDMANGSRGGETSWTLNLLLSAPAKEGA